MPICVAFMQSLYFNNSRWYTKSLTFGFPRAPSIVPRFRRDFPSGAFSYSATPSGVGSSHTSSLAKLTPAADNKCSSFLYLQFQGDGGVWSEQTFYFRTKNSGLRTHCLWTQVEIKGSEFRSVFLIYNFQLGYPFISKGHPLPLFPRSLLFIPPPSSLLISPINSLLSSPPFLSL